MYAPELWGGPDGYAALFDALANVEKTKPIGLRAMRGIKADAVIRDFNL